MKQANILIVHLAATGDCLMVTALARQAKHDFPGCRLTWAIGSRSRHVLNNNPHVDEVWEVDFGKRHPFEAWRDTRKEALERKKRGEFDKVFFTQIYPDYAWRFDGTTRSSTFRAWPGEITVPVSPVLILSDDEIQHAASYSEKHGLSRYRHVVLFECMPGSHQSDMNPRLALDVAARLVRKNPGLAVILSTHEKIETGHADIFDASSLTYRENKALASHCTFFIGCSSGITWLLTSEGSPMLPSLQVLRLADGFGFASVKYDFAYWKLPHNHIAEVTVTDAEKLSNIASDCLAGFSAAAEKYNEALRPLPHSYRDNITLFTVRGNLRNLLRSASYFRKRNNTNGKETADIYLFICRSTLLYGWHRLLHLPAAILRRFARAVTPSRA